MHNQTGFVRRPGFVYPLVFLALASVACGGSAEVPVPESDTEDALSRPLVDGVVAAVLERGATSASIGTPTKVRAVMGALKRSTSRPAACAVRNEAKLSLFDAEGRSLGLAKLECFRGTLELATGESIPVTIAPSKLAVFDETPRVGDALWGIDRITIGVRQGTKWKATDVTAREDIAAIVEGYKRNEMLDPERPMPRCLPSRRVSFSRGQSEAAFVSYSCTAGGSGTVHGSMSIGDVTGAVTLEAGPVETLLARP